MCEHIAGQKVAQLHDDDEFLLNDPWRLEVFYVNAACRLY